MSNLIRRSLLALTTLALLLAPAAHTEDKPDLGKLIRQLGSDEFEEREKAQQALEALGEDDLPALRAAAAKSDDAEVKRRLGAVIAAVETRFTKDPYAFIEKVGGRVVKVNDDIVEIVDGRVVPLPEPRPVKARPADTVALSVSLIDAKFSDADLHRLKELGKVTCLTLAGTKVTDGGVAALKSLPDLEYLCLDRTAVTDGGLPHLKSLKDLVFHHYGSEG